MRKPILAKNYRGALPQVFRAKPGVTSLVLH